MAQSSNKDVRDWLLVMINNYARYQGKCTRQCLFLKVDRSPWGSMRVASRLMSKCWSTLTEMLEWIESSSKACNEGTDFTVMLNLDVSIGSLLYACTVGSGSPNFAYTWPTHTRSWHPGHLVNRGQRQKERITVEQSWCLNLLRIKINDDSLMQLMSLLIIDDHDAQAGKTTI